MSLTSSWQQVSAVYTPVAPGSSNLDFEAFTSSAPVGVCVQSDDASITLNQPDTTLPDTFIDSGPSGSVTDTSATFSFSADEPSTFQCSLDGGAFAPCASPVTYTNLIRRLAHLPGGCHRRLPQRRRDPRGAELDRARPAE